MLKLTKEELWLLWKRLDTWVMFECELHESMKTPYECEKRRYCPARVMCSLRYKVRKEYEKEIHK